MTNPTITADDGSKYEIDHIGEKHGKKFYMLVPIDQPAQEEKFHSSISFSISRGVLYQNDKLRLTKPTAEAVANAIKAVVEYIENPTWDLQQGSHVCEMINAAAMAYQGDKS